MKEAKKQTPKLAGYERQRNRARNLERQLSKANQELDLLKKNYEKFSKIEDTMLEKVLHIVEDTENEYHKAQFLRDQVTPFKLTSNLKNNKKTFQ